MKPPMFLLILLLITCAATGKVDIRTEDIYQAVGSSFSFPAVNMTDEAVYDLRTVSKKLIFTYHGIENVRPPYNERADFYSRTATFVLKNLKVDDSDTYEQVVNMKVVARIPLHVIELVKKPILRKVNETIDGGQCHVLLECILGPVPCDVIFLKDGEEITENITRMHQSAYLSIDAWDPGAPGKYICKVWNPLRAKTSSEVELPSPDDSNCKKATSQHQNWGTLMGIIFIIITIIIIIGLCFIVMKKYLKANGQKPNQLEDEETGDTIREETSQLESPLLNENQSGAQRSGESSRKYPTTDPEEPGENMTLDNGPALPTAENSPNILDPGHPGQEGTCTMELKVYEIASDHGQVANG